MQGEEAARLFYSDRFTRRGALPPPILTLLQDKGSVQLLDAAAHRHRKQLFLSLLKPAALQRLAELATEQWRSSIARWENFEQVVLLSAVEEILCRTACAWTGVRLGDAQARRRTAEFAAMIDGAGSLGLRNWRGHVARRRSEKWVSGIVAAIRAGNLDVAENTPAFAIVSHRDERGRPLPDEVVTVELINILRPTVAVARFIVFAALALHDHRASCAQLQWDREADIECFVHEVRRFYPVFPAVAGRTADEFEWRRYRFPPGTRVLLDIYGTNRDPRAWDRPDEFRPERFRAWDGNPYTFIPQGGGDHGEGHRCAGEWTTITLMKVAVAALTRTMTYEVPPQNLRVRLSRMPTQPESHFLIRRVKST